MKKPCQTETEVELGAIEEQLNELRIFICVHNVARTASISRKFERLQDAIKAAKDSLIG